MEGLPFCPSRDGRTCTSLGVTRNLKVYKVCMPRAAVSNMPHAARRVVSIVRAWPRATHSCTRTYCLKAVQHASSVHATIHATSLRLRSRSSVKTSPQPSLLEISLAWQGTEADVGRGRVDDVLVDLVGQHQQPRVRRHHRRQLLQLRPVGRASEAASVHAHAHRAVCKPMILPEKLECQLFTRICQALGARASAGCCGQRKRTLGGPCYRLKTSTEP